MAGTPDMDMEQSGASFPFSTYYENLNGERMGSISSWVLNGKEDRASKQEGKKRLNSFQEETELKLHWQVSFLLHLFYRPPSFCLHGILHIL